MVWAILYLLCGVWVTAVWINEVVRRHDERFPKFPWSVHFTRIFAVNLLFWPLRLIFWNR